MCQGVPKTLTCVNRIGMVVSTGAPGDFLTSDSCGRHPYREDRFWNTFQSATFVFI